MQLRDEVPDRPTGRLICRAYRNGVLIDTLDDANLVVTASKQIQCNALGNTSGWTITQMGFGTNGTNPALTDTALTGQYAKAFDSVTFPATNQVQFNFSLGVNEANGLSIQEFGLLTTNGKLFARKVRLAALVKQSDITLSGSWIITF
jgi:Flp pilus assembly protein TadG